MEKHIHTNEMVFEISHMVILSRLDALESQFYDFRSESWRFALSLSMVALHCSRVS